MSDMKIGARRYVFNQGDIVEEDALFVDAEDYDELVKEHDANVLMLKAFQKLFKQVEPEVARLRAALHIIRDAALCGDETSQELECYHLADDALNSKPNLNDNPESEEEAY